MYGRQPAPANSCPAKADTVKRFKELPLQGPELSFIAVGYAEADAEADTEEAQLCSPAGGGVTETGCPNVLVGSVLLCFLSG